MNVLFTILAVLVLIASVFVTLIVLLQNGKGGGLASNFVAGNQTFGVRQTADILEKITWGLVAFIFVVSIVTTFTLNTGSREVDYTEKMETEAPAPEFPSAPVENPADSSAN
ncbi:MAG: preprotein translocase subunit SecG [Bacteroidales bacterium]|nr:preprotein translocase subunit SecG [Bacteroidales bacterium]MDD5891433.1 preprotein translocase subunit SecG [Bacteroidales bacterium]